MRLLALTWILGGMLIGIGASEYLWRSNITSPFTWLWFAGGLLLVTAVLGTAVAASRCGSPLAVIGLPIFVLGFLTLAFGIGVIGVVAGLTLYAIGLGRAHVIARRALAAAVALLAVALPASIAFDNQLAGIEIAVASAMTTGVGLELSRVSMMARLS